MRDRSPNGATTAAITDVEKAAKAVSDGATPAEMQALADAMRKLADNMRSYSDAVKATVNDLKRSTEAANQELARRVNEIQSTSGNSGF